MHEDKDRLTIDVFILLNNVPQI